MQDEKELKNMTNFSSNLEIGKCSFNIEIFIHKFENRNTSIS